MELIARLYADLEPTNDELLGVFFQRSVNDLGVVLFSEYSPRPLPSQPPLPGPTPRLAMDHYRETTKVELKKTFQFLMDRIKRDLIVVETVFGMTSAARQQLLSHVTDGVVKPFVMQQIKLAETHHTFMANAEATLSPRSRRKSAARVADAISYHYTMESSLFTFYQDYMKELRDLFQSSEVEFLNRFVDVIFVDRTTYAKEQPETSLLQRIFTLIEEQYTRPLHPVPGEHFDIQEAHMQKAKQMVQAMTEVAERVKVYAPPRTQGPYVLSIVQLSLKAVGKFLDEELTKTYNSLKADHDNWRLKPKSEEVLLHPPTPESQQCAFRLLLFAQSTLMSLSDAVAAVCCTLLKSAPSLLKDVAEAEAKELELLDERAEKTLNYALQAVVIRSLSILYHYQLKTDYLIKVNKSAEDTMAPPCSRACTLFCYYLTAQLRDMKEFISMSHGQLSSRVGAGNSANYNQNTKTHFDLTAAVAEIAEHNNMNNNNNNNTGREDGLTTDGLTATRTRARIMNYQQLLYGDGGPSSLVRTLGVCLYRGISVHLKSFAANDKGAFVYKQDVTAYKECLLPLTSLDGLGAAVVEVLFQILKETANLLLMPLDHIKEVKDSGLLRILPNEEKLKYIRIRQDVRDAFKVIQRRKKKKERERE
ncbi:hypothetical protein AGDE_12252 [Angomonas deanei]|nr:hypothetical protein AGDE_12252 [Angomonas deanei]|eukprot:EPY24627.1 hypothetical protein AGDE_12252 [Angomonas deanei]